MHEKYAIIYDQTFVRNIDTYYVCVVFRNTRKVHWRRCNDIFTKYLNVVALFDAVKYLQVLASRPVLLLLRIRPIKERILALSSDNTP